MQGDYVNEIFKESVNLIDEVSSSYNYEENISHLLYLIASSFMIRYRDAKSQVIRMFHDVRINIDDAQDKMTQAYFMAVPYKEGDKFYSNKVIVLRNYKDISLMQLLDNLTHEFNHAMNSMINSVLWDDKYVRTRVGLSYTYYDKNTLKFVKRDSSYILEEIINTRQTEELINIINSFNNYEIDNINISNTLYAVHSSINNKYNSDSYALGSVVSDKLLENKTFYSTLSNLRLKGEVDSVTSWFDDIEGNSGSYDKLIQILLELQKIDESYSKTIFKKVAMNKARNLYASASEIIDNFNRNCNFK